MTDQRASRVVYFQKYIPNSRVSIVLNLLVERLRLQQIYAIIALAGWLLSGSSIYAQKEALNESVENREEASWKIARQIWEWAEPGYQESKSSTLLADTLEKAGFEVKRGVAKIPTAFTATIGSGKPVIAVLGEYDALPELSQDDVPFRKPRPGNIYGHACGHNLFGTASVSACLALAEEIKKGNIKGTLRFYGCPAEEGGSAKAFMVRDGLFQDCDIALHWHPGSRNLVGDASCLSRAAVKFRFYGIASHAAAAPEKGRSALDAAELCAHATELLREHTPDFTRIHHTITHGGGGAPNVVPEFAEMFFYVRHPDFREVQKLYPRLVKCAEAGALATETKLETLYLGGTLELMPNNTLAQAVKKNLVPLNRIHYSPEEMKFALRIQETLSEKADLDLVRRVDDVSGSVGKGSTDVGDVSWVVPTSGFYTACFVPGTSAHSWQATAATGSSLGKQGMQLAAKTLAATAWDLYHDPKLIETAKEEFVRRLDGRKYQSLIPKDLNPPLNYRDPPKTK
jgi:aminobenzoyl-glutamate utilization protein B